MSLPPDGAVDIVPVVSAAEVIVIAPKDVLATTPSVPSYTACSAGCVMNTSLVPALKLTSDPELDDEYTLVRLRVVPDSVYVP
jgi:hypothetical protein